MRQRRKMTRGRARRIDREVARGLNGRGPRIGIGEQEAGERPGERSLADPFGTADQPGMGEPPLAVGREHLRLGALVADQARGVARMGRARGGVAFGLIVGLGALHR